MPLRLDGDDPGAVESAAELLRSGAVVAIPTDTVYGLAVDPMVPGAVGKVFALKGRPADVPVPVLVAGWDQVASVAGTLEAAAQGLADRYWPGALTLVVPRSRPFEVDLGGGPGARWTVGIRWADHPVVRALCLAVGPLAVTSANRHGQAPATTAVEVEAGLPDGGWLGAVVDGGVCSGLPSTVVECRGPASRLLREGLIPWDEVGRMRGRAAPA